MNADLIDLATPHVVRAPDGHRWENVGRYRVLDEQGYCARPVGESRNINVSGVFLPFEKCEDGTWRAVGRGGVPSYVLAGKPSVLRRRVPEEGQ